MDTTNETGAKPPTCWLVNWYTEETVHEALFSTRGAAQDLIAFMNVQIVRHVLQITHVSQMAEGIVPTERERVAMCGTAEAYLEAHFEPIILARALWRVAGFIY